MSSSPARLFVIAAPSGAGKTTLVKSLLERNPELRFSVSYTTREQRNTEIEGHDYFFVNEARFLQLKAEKELLESALVFGNYYGTGRVQVQEHLAKGNHVILEIDWQGARQVRESMPDSVSIFILPPARPELERRLRDRGTDNDEVIARRLQERPRWSSLSWSVIRGSGFPCRTRRASNERPRSKAAIIFSSVRNAFCN